MYGIEHTVIYAALNQFSFLMDVLVSVKLLAADRLISP